MKTVKFIEQKVCDEIRNDLTRLSRRSRARLFGIKLNHLGPRDISFGVNIISDLCLSSASTSTASVAAGGWTYTASFVSVRLN